MRDYLVEEARVHEMGHPGDDENDSGMFVYAYYPASTRLPTISGYRVLRNLLDFGG